MVDRGAPAGKPSKGGAIGALALLAGSAVTALMIGDIRDDEGRRLHAYRDIGGIVTICDGDTHNVRMGQVASDGECDERTAQQLLVHARIVLGCAPALREVGREQQLRAFTRMDYNTGAFCKGWFRSRPSPAKLVNAGQIRAACDELLHYDMVRGKRIRGLTLRRQRERAVCVQGLDR
jgi:lysozyme